MLAQSSISEIVAEYQGNMDDGFGQGTNWRDVFAEEDSGVIWENLLCLIESAATDEAANSLEKAQGLFLSLLSTNSLLQYVENGYAPHEIEQELLSLIRTI